MCKKKIDLVFDGTILANGYIKDASRSGIYFVVYNVFKQLLKHDDISVTLYAKAHAYSHLKMFLDENFSGRQFKIITNCPLLFYYKLKRTSLRYKRYGRHFSAFLMKVISLLSSPLCHFIGFFYDYICAEKINNGDLYLSLAHKKPKHVKIRTYTLLHDLIPLLLPDYVTFKKGYWLYNLCQTFNKNDYYFANSDATRKDFLKHYPIIDENKIKTVLLACSEDFRPCSIEETIHVKEKYNIPADKKYIFSLCTLEPRKNLIRNIKMFIKFIKKHNIDNLVFVLGGGHWQEFISVLEKEVSDLDEFKDKIYKIGYVEDEDLPALYSGAEWFTYTSRYEGFGLPPLEAMSCGCPVITSNNSSLPEVVGDAGIMIDWDSDEQHLEAFEKYWFNPDLREENRQKGLQRAKQFSWEKCTNEILQIIKATYSE